MFGYLPNKRVVILDLGYVLSSQLRCVGQSSDRVAAIEVEKTKFGYGLLEDGRVVNSDDCSPERAVGIAANLRSVLQVVIGLLLDEFGEAN